MTAARSDPRDLAYYSVAEDLHVTAAIAAYKAGNFLRSDRHCLAAQLAAMAQERMKDAQYEYVQAVAGYV